jgi:hypothetical protein
MDIYRCHLTNGVPGPHENLGPPINGSAYECCPVISADGNSFFICSDRAGGYGSMDVRAFQRSGGAWGNAVNLGPQVNTPQTDCPRWISDDGSTLLICSTRTGGYGSWGRERHGPTTNRRAKWNGWARGLEPPTS